MSAIAQPRESTETQELFAGLYAELTLIARRELRRAGQDQLRSATSLLHDAYICLSQREGLEFSSRPQFMAYATRVMRRLLIDYARSRSTLKRGGDVEFTSILPDVPGQTNVHAQLERLSEAIERLARTEPRQARVIDLKYFGGFSFGDIAALLGISERTVQRDWDKAREFLLRCLIQRRAC